MIYLLLHQDRSEEIERGASREISVQERENFATVAKFHYNSEIFATVAKFRYNSEIFATPKISLLIGNFATKRIFPIVDKFRYVAKFSPAAKIPVLFFFFCTNDPVFG